MTAVDRVHDVGCNAAAPVVLDGAAMSLHRISLLAAATLVLAGPTDFRTDGPNAPASDATDEHDVAEVAAAFGNETVEAAAGPDRVSDRIGGLAARLHDADGNRIPGNLFLLMGREGSTAPARLHDHTPYTHDRGHHADTRASNELAATVIGRLIDAEIPVIEMTSAPGGGPSSGAIYAIAYLDIVSHGAFTGNLRIAATGELDEHGHINSIRHVDVKTSAAQLADADVFFTPNAPSIDTQQQFGARFVGESVRNRTTTGASYHSPERVELFRNWGADRIDGDIDGMDIVDARHLIDVAAYLCGTGSHFACNTTNELIDHAEDRHHAINASRTDTGGTDTANRLPTHRTHPDNTPTNASRVEQDAVNWAVGQFESAGLDLPPVEISFSTDPDDCSGEQGVYRRRAGEHSVVVCVPDLEGAAIDHRRKRTLLHELAHAWDHATLTDADRRDVLQRFGSDDWYAPDRPWGDRPVEQLAETLTWGLLGQPRRPLLIDRACQQVNADFRIVTGRDPLGPIGPSCAIDEVQIVDTRVEFVDMPDEFVDIANWAIALFDEAGLRLPPMRFVHHGDDRTRCSGRRGTHRHVDGHSTIDDHTCDDLDAGYRSLTGQPPLHGYEDHC